MEALPLGYGSVGANFHHKTTYLDNRGLCFSIS